MTRDDLIEDIAETLYDLDNGAFSPRFDQIEFDEAEEFRDTADDVFVPRIVEFVAKWLQGHPHYVDYPAPPLQAQWRKEMAS